MNCYRQELLTYENASYKGVIDMVYVLTKGGINKRDNKPYQIAKQKFVKLGDTIGNKIIIVSGVSSGEIVVSVGQLKLQNNSRVRVNNTIK